MAIISKKGKFWHAEDWPTPVIEDAERRLLRLLEGVGTIDHERFFRMYTTACIQRGLTDDEIENAPEWWRKSSPKGIAGAPIHIYRQEGVTVSLSGEICSSPTKTLCKSGILLPGDCGACPSCLSRLKKVSALSSVERARGVNVHSPAMSRS